jgi:aspartate/methionine/tyrosine aminotransferase
MFADRTNWNLSSNRLSQALSRHRSSDHNLLDLTASNPTECGFRYDAKLISVALEQPGILEYHPDPRGLASARQAVRDYYAALSACVALGDIILTTGTSEAYSFAFRLLCDPDDELLIPAPSYPLFDFLADILDVKLVRYALFYDHGWHIDFHALEQAVTPRTRGVIVVHPNNPTGHFTKAAEMERLNGICAKRDLAIIADEVFLDFDLNPPPPSFAANTGALTFTTSGLSKISGLPQMKFAWLIASGPDAKKREAMARLEVIADTYLSLSTPSQLAAPMWLEQRHNFHEQVMARVRHNLAELDAKLVEQKVCSRLEVEGGWYAVLRVPATRSDDDLAIELLEKHDVYVHPGHFFNFPGEGYLVVSLITPEAVFADGIRRLLGFVDH